SSGALVVAHLLERDSYVDGRLSGQAEHALADDVPLNLVGAARDRCRGNGDDRLCDRSLEQRVRAGQHGGWTGHAGEDARRQFGDLATAEFAERSLRPRLAVSTFRRTGALGIPSR